jgi:transcriptional regulator with XRE-family HTH domain
MGRKSRLRVNRLPEKLLQIRKALGLSQNGMVQRIGLEEITDRSVISAYERGEREPSLPVLLRYARSVEVVVDYLIDDDLDLQKGIKKVES